MKLTPWFVGTLNPIRVGVYERVSSYGVGYSYWNRRFWGMQGSTIDEAIKLQSKPSLWQTLPWRGVAK